MFLSTLNHSSSDMNVKIEPPLLSIVIVVHLFIIALGLLGNSLIIYLVVVNMRLRNARNAFMLNLTFSNILLVTICTPSFLVSISSPSWTMGAFWCKFLHSVQIVVVLVSAFSIAMIAIDRWIFVVYSHSHQLKNGHVFAIVVGIWLLAIALSVPTFITRQTRQLYDDSFFNRIKELQSKFAAAGFFSSSSSSLNKNVNLQNSSSISSSHSRPLAAVSIKPNSSTLSSEYGWYGLAKESSSSSSSSISGSISMSSMERENAIYCTEDWPDPIYKRVYILVLFVLEFVLPCLTMLVTYIWIIRFLKMHDDKMNTYERLHKNLVQKERHHQKNCKVLSVLCLTFIICCLPLSFFNIKSEFEVNEYMAAATSSSSSSEAITATASSTGEDATSPKQKQIYWSLTLLTTLEELNAILSPLLYGWMNHNFRNAINEKLTALKSNIKQNHHRKSVHDQTQNAVAVHQLNNKQKLLLVRN